MACHDISQNRYFAGIIENHASRDNKHKSYISCHLLKYKINKE